MTSNSRPVSTPAGDDPTSRSASKRSDLGFPGGRAHLPRMRQDGGPDLTRREEPTECKPVFQEYFSVESLFAPPDATEEAIRARPWTVLGVPEDASWADIQSAHRRLAKQLHPDRFVGASEAQRRWAEEAIRRVNEAMADLRAVYLGVQQ